MELEIGKEYRVIHERKGTFNARVTAVNGEWIDCEVTDGKAGAMLDYNERYPGESVTLRDRFCTFEAVNDQESLEDAIENCNLKDITIMEMRVLLCDVAQILDGWKHVEPKDWTDWDQSVRDRISKHLEQR